jgi:hypothetical protein
MIVFWRGTNGHVEVGDRRVARDAFAVAFMPYQKIPYDGCEEAHTVQIKDVLSGSSYRSISATLRQAAVAAWRDLAQHPEQWIAPPYRALADNK